MVFDLVLKNGLVVDTYNNLHQKHDIGIIDGKIAEVSEEINNGKEIIDMAGKVVLPGVIDMHTHITRSFGDSVGYKMVAETGVTTTIDFAGPIEDIHLDFHEMGSGLNVGSIEALIPGTELIANDNPTYNEVDDFLQHSLERGSLGLKLFGGHSPLTPDATKAGIDVANKHEVMVAFHAGTTATGSDMTGVREAFEMVEDKKLLLAHINAYCRGRVANPYDELKEVFSLLRNHPNVFADSHLAVMNGTLGNCVNGVPDDYVTRICLELFGYPVSEKGLAAAMYDGVAQSIKSTRSSISLIKGEEAVAYWKENNTDIAISFPVNLPNVGVACMLEREKPAGDFLIEMASTDGGGIPRNDLVGRMLSLVQLGYLTLDEMVNKTAVAPARVFGLQGKGHLGKGADADITVIDLEKSKAVMSIVSGEVNMVDGIVLRKGGRLLVTEQGVKAAKKSNFDYQVIDFANSSMYKN